MYQWPGGPNGTAIVDQALEQALQELSLIPTDALLTARYEKFRRMGAEGTSFIDTDAPPRDTPSGS